MAYLHYPTYAKRTASTVVLRAVSGAELELPIEDFDAVVIMRIAQLAQDPEVLAATMAAVARRCRTELGADALLSLLRMISTEAVARRQAGEGLGQDLLAAEDALG